MGRFAGAAGSYDEEMGNLHITVDILDRKFHKHKEATMVRGKGGKGKRREGKGDGGRIAGGRDGGLMREANQRIGQFRKEG